MCQETDAETELLKRACDPREYTPRLRRTLASTCGVHDSAEREAVELARGADGVSTHIIERQPVADGKRGGQSRCGGHAINAVTRWPPHACDPRSGSDVRGDVERAAECEHARMDHLMVEHDAVESTINTLVDVVYRAFRQSVRTCDLTEKTYTSRWAARHPRGQQVPQVPRNPQSRHDAR